MELVSLVRLEGVAKHVILPDDSRLDILRDIELAIAAGDHVAIVGRSGSGKSTLLNLMGMLDRPSEGAVWFRGEPVRKMRRGKLDKLRGRNVGFVFQQFNLLAGRTALENVEMPLGYASGRSFWNRRRTATAMLERVGLGHRIDSTPEQLSGGEQQRVAIARAMVNRPPILLADEPTGNLDPTTSLGIMRLLDRINRTGTTVVMATHDEEIVNQMRKRVLELETGTLVRDQAHGAYGARGQVIPDPTARPAQEVDGATDGAPATGAVPAAEDAGSVPAPPSVPTSVVVRRESALKARRHAEAAAGE